MYPFKKWLGNVNYDPKVAEEITKTSRELVTRFVEQFSKFAIDGDSFSFVKNKYVQDFNLEVDDIVDFIDAEGYYFCKAKICAVDENTAYVELEYLPGKQLNVRRSDLLKIVPQKNV